MGFLTFAQADVPAAGGIIAMLVPLLFMLGVFYFLLIRPQRQQEKRRQEMLKALKKNDKVVTIGGIHGVVANIRPDDEVVTLKVDEPGKVRMKVSRSAISRIESAKTDQEQE